MANSAIYGPMEATQAVIEFESAGKDQFSPPAYIVRDVLILQKIARLLAHTARDIALLFSTLDTAKRATDAQGAALRTGPFTAADVDEYAVVEALFWDRLSNEAETLLKVLLRRALGEAQP